MKLAILGASGGCGKELVAQAQKRGHNVTAVVRSPSSAPQGTRAVIGDLTLDRLKEALHGQDAVLSALGLRLKSIAPWARPEVPDLLSRTTPLLVEAMRAEGVKRAIAISSGGVGDSYASSPAFFKVFMSITALRHVIPELNAMEQALLGSDLDVCVCRPTGLTNEPATGRVVVAKQLAGRATIPRADVAGWMLDAIEKPSFEHRTPLITVTGAL